MSICKPTLFQVPKMPSLDNDDEKTDYISNLPDAILSVILSFLPCTCYAVSTATLSKRWRYVWTKVPLINLKDFYRLQRLRGFKQENVYDFLNRVVRLNDVSCLDLFAIAFKIYDDESLDAITSSLDVIRWRDFCELDMKMILDPDFSPLPLPLPKEFLSSQRLAVLKLDGFCLDDLQVSFHFPNLETVHFGLCTVFPSDQFLKRFLSGCPALKNLYIAGGRGLGHIYVESSTLDSLEIKLLGHGGGEPPARISIKAPNLRNLILFRAAAHYDIGALNLLTEADIILCISDVVTDDNLAYLTEKVSGARTLHLGFNNVSSCVEQVPKFENLTQLRVKNDGRAYEILKRTPKLKSLIYDSNGHRHGENSWDSEGVPECLSCLEKVELLWFKKSDTRVVEYFLKTGPALKEMIVMVSVDANIQYCRGIRRTLLETPTLSSVCQVKVFLCNRTRTGKGRPIEVD